MKIVDGEKAVMGRLASFVAKEILKGEEIAVINCEKIIITGNKKTIENDFQIKRSRYGDSHKGPIHSKTSEKIVKRAIRGMIPNHRIGRGREAFKRVKCYNKIPEEFKDKEMIKMNSEKIKFIRVGELNK
jgi:large subunit ribosomal protein L13